MGIFDDEPWHSFVVNLAVKKATTGFGKNLLRGIACNILVCAGMKKTSWSVEEDPTSSPGSPHSPASYFFFFFFMVSSPRVRPVSAGTEAVD